MLSMQLQAPVPARPSRSNPIALAGVESMTLPKPAYIYGQLTMSHDFNGSGMARPSVMNDCM